MSALLLSAMLMEDEPISNIALIPQIKTLTYPYEPAADRHPYRDPRPDYPFSNIPEREFILDTSVPKLAVSVEKPKRTFKKDLSRYLSNIKPAGEQTDYEFTSQNKVSKPRYLMQTIQSVCSQYLEEDSASREAQTVSDATLELITYLCKEYSDALTSASGESSEWTLEDDKLLFAQNLRSRSDESSYGSGKCKKELSNCKKLEWSNSYLRSLGHSLPPVARCRPCADDVPLARSRPLPCPARVLVARSPPLPREPMSVNRITDGKDWRALREYNRGAK